MTQFLGDQVNGKARLNMANQIPVAFADRIITVRLENILPLRKLDFDPKEHRKTHNLNGF